MISLSKDMKGNISSTGSLKILDYPMHEMVALIFKLEYRGKRDSWLFHQQLCPFSQAAES